MREEHRRLGGQRPPLHVASAVFVDIASDRYKTAMEYAVALEEQIAKLSEGGSAVSSALPAGSNANGEASALTTGTAGTAGPLIDAFRL